MKRVLNFVALLMGIVGCLALAVEVSQEFTILGQYKKDPPYKIGFSMHLSGIDWTTQWQREFELEAEAYKRAGIISEYYVVSCMGDPSKQIADIEDLVAKGCDAIIVSPSSPTALIPLIDRLHARGIPLLITQVMYGGEKYAALYHRGDLDYGRVTAEWLVNKLVEKYGEPRGNIIVLQGIPGAGANEARWTLGAKPIFERYPGIKIVGIGAGDWDYAKAKAVAETLVAANPVIDGVWTAGGQMTLAVLHVFLEQGRPLVPMAGEDYNGLLKAWIQYKDLGFDTIAPCKPTWESRIALQIAVNLLRGMTVCKKVIYPTPYITWETVHKYVRPTLPDYVWCNTSLTDDELRALYGLK
ncbi:MAG: ABC transporter substrate-binding protein [Candidatus Bathyarchaeia archaeon]